MSLSTTPGDALNFTAAGSLTLAGAEIAAFDGTEPAAVTYTGALQRAGDVSPEGVLFIAAADSPNGRDLVVTSTEVSNTISVFTADPAPFRLQLLHFADADAGLLAGRTAPNLAALVDAFDGTYANTLILAGGPGADIFAFNGFAESLRGQSDRIRDFNGAEGDRISFSGIDADPLADGNQAFAFVGTGAFLAGTASIRVVHGATGTARQVDSGNGGSPEMVVVLLGQPTLQASDFIL